MRIRKIRLVFIAISFLFVVGSRVNWKSHFVISFSGIPGSKACPVQGAAAAAFADSLESAENADMAAAMKRASILKITTSLFLIDFIITGKNRRGTKLP